MSKKEILVPFDLAKAKAGAKLRDRDGYNCRLVCDNMNTTFGTRIVVVVTNYDNTEKLRVLYPNGQALKEEQCHDDVLIVEEVEEPDRWIDRMGGKVKGWCLSAYSGRAITASSTGEQKVYWKAIFATEKQVAAAAATAQISQIMANDKRFGGVVTDEEWNNEEIEKFILHRAHDRITISITVDLYNFIAFHTKEQAELFLEENRDLVEQFYML